MPPSEDPGAQLRAHGFPVPSEGTPEPCDRCGAAAGAPCRTRSGHRALVELGRRCSESLRLPWQPGFMKDRENQRPRALRARDEANSLPVASLVDRLVRVLGLRLVAYIGSAADTGAVREWISSDDRDLVDEDAIARLRLALQTAILIAHRDSTAVVQAWFQGLNPLLGDVAPARLLREGDLELAAEGLLSAASAFGAHG